VSTKAKAIASVLICCHRPFSQPSFTDGSEEFFRRFSTEGDTGPKTPEPHLAIGETVEAEAVTCLAVEHEIIGEWVLFKFCDGLT
jgi:hypothetical protein